MGRFIGFCYRQLTFKPKPLPSDISLKGKTVLVTGANSGLGLEASRELAQNGVSRLILAVRDISKGEAAKSSIAETSASCEIEVWSLDYDSYESIAGFGKRIDALDRLDLALLNAGVKKMQYSASHTGHEFNVQINHIGTSAVSLMILSALQKTAQVTRTPSRMTIVTSEGHFWVPFHERNAQNILERMDDSSTFGNAMQRYYTTKLLNVFWTRELAARVSEDQIVINAVNPGFCYSGLHRHETTGIVKIFLWMFGWSSVQGGHCLTDAVVSHGESHGKYLSEQTETAPSAFVLSPDGQVAQKKIWEETLALLKREAPIIDTSKIHEILSADPSVN